MATIQERLKDAPPRLIILAACGFARTVAQLLTEQCSSDAIETAERFADGLASQEDVIAAVGSALSAAKTANPATWAAASAAEAAAWIAWTARAVGAALSAAKVAEAPESILDCLLPSRIQAPFPTHVQGLATTIYDNRDWALMAVLADALEEVGQDEMATHCRQPIHAKGCHVLDSILGR